MKPASECSRCQPSNRNMSFFFSVVPTRAKHAIQVCTQSVRVLAHGALQALQGRLWPRNWVSATRKSRRPVSEFSSRSRGECLSRSYTRPPPTTTMRPTAPSWLKLLVPVKRTVDCRFRPSSPPPVGRFDIGSDAPPSHRCRQDPSRRERCRDERCQTLDGTHGARPLPWHD